MIQYEIFNEVEKLHLVFVATFDDNNLNKVICKKDCDCLSFRSRSLKI